MEQAKQERAYVLARKREGERPEPLCFRPAPNPEHRGYGRVALPGEEPTRFRSIFEVLEFLTRPPCSIGLPFPDIWTGITAASASLPLSERMVIAREIPGSERHPVIIPATNETADGWVIAVTVARPGGFDHAYVVDYPADRDTFDPRSISVSPELREARIFTLAHQRWIGRIFTAIVSPKLAPSISCPVLRPVKLVAPPTYEEVV